MRQAFAIAGPASGDDERRQAAFHQFRRSIDAAMVDAGVELRLVVHTSKTSPDARFCWFEGSDDLAEELAEMSEREHATSALPKLSSQ
jgi:sugar phosphate isomerase/epimerase